MSDKKNNTRGSRGNKPKAEKAPLPVEDGADATEGSWGVDEDGQKQCILCVHPIDNINRYNTVGQCGHTGCCSLCALRMRQLLGDSRCVICKTDLPRVICIENVSQTFDSFQSWGEDNIGPAHQLDEASQMFFYKHNLPSVNKLRDPWCRECGKSFHSLSSLQSHLQQSHKLQFCAICLEHKKVFLQELELFTKDQMKKHHTKGDPEQGFTGHPRCDFCFTRFYSSAELYDHLHKNHFECDICLHSLNIQNRFYKDYNDLENHFRAEHYLCEQPECLAKKFVVFKSHIDLQGHLTAEHPNMKTSRKIKVNFKIRRADHDATSNGSARQSDGFEDVEQFHTLDQAPPSGGDRTINVADFPSLSANAQSPSISLWERQALSRPRMEDFPELSAGSHAAPSGGAFRNALQPPPTAAMQAHMDTNGWEYPAYNEAAAALGANNPLMRFVKPAKKKKGKKKAAPKLELEEKKAPQQVEEESEEEEESGETPSKSALVLRIRQVLGSDAKYEAFREDCRQFRFEQVDLAAFYTKMRKLFTSADFDQLFLKLMKLFPDEELVDSFIKYHREQTRQSAKKQGFNEVASKKKKAVEQKTPIGGAGSRQSSATATSAWNNALQKSGIGRNGQGNGKGSVIINKTSNVKRDKSASPASGNSWSSSNSWQRPTSAPQTTSYASASAAPPTQSFASMQIQPRPTPAPTPAPTNFRTSKSDFPSLPTPGQALGVQQVTRATWDDQVQSIAQNRPTGKKNKKKKTMTLGEMAMKFQ